MQDEDNDAVVFLGPDADFGAGLLVLHDASGEPRAGLQLGDGNRGELLLVSQDGTIAVWLGVDVEGAGFVWVADREGQPIAGIAGDTGQVWGTDKTFRVPDPEHPERDIVYTSVESPAALLSHVGTAELAAGAGSIELPEHFVRLAALDTLSVVVTPADPTSRGLAVGAPAGRRIPVRELNGGRGGYRFHFVAHAIRRGYEDRRVYQPRVAMP